MLAMTRKTGALHLRRGEAHGVLHLAGGALSGGSPDLPRLTLARRLVASGGPDEAALAAAVERAAAEPGTGMVRALLDAAALDVEQVRALAADHVHDVVFELMRWPDGTFVFVVDEPDPDDVGVAVPVPDAVEEAQRRLAVWTTLAAAVRPPASVPRLVGVPPEDPVVSRDEWGVLALVDGRRSVADVVARSGRGEYAAVSALAALAERGLLVVDGGDGDPLADRLRLLARLEEGQPQPPVALPLQRHDTGQPDKPRDPGQAASTGPDGAFPVDGSLALALEVDEHDPDVVKSLLLRLIPEPGDG